MSEAEVETAGSVTWVEACRLTVAGGAPDGAHAWAYAQAHAAAIDAHWQSALTQNPSFFDGTVFVMTAHHQRLPAHFEAELQPVKFREFLYWRDHGMSDPTVFDCFGSAILMSCDGGVLLGRQMPGNINAGRTYLPGGFIDPRDVDVSGGIDMAANVTRELAEETGIAGDDLRRDAGFYLTEIGQQISFGVAFRSAETAAILQQRIRAHIARETAPELADVVFAHSLGDIDGLDVPAYARLLLSHVFSS